MTIKPANRVVVGDCIVVSDDTTRRRTVECRVMAVCHERRARGRLYIVLVLDGPGGMQVSPKAWQPHAAVRMA